MGAVRYRLHSAFGAQWPVVLVMTVVVAVVSGAVLAFSAGAARTASAPDRYVDSLGPIADAVINQDHARSRSSEVAALPGSRSVQAATFLFSGLRRPDSDEPADGLVFAGTYQPLGAPGGRTRSGSR